MKRKIFSMLLVLTMVLSLLPGTAWAAVYEESFGAEGTSFSFNTGTKTLTIYGNGVIPSRDFTSAYYGWGFSIKDVKKVVIKSGVTKIGANAFREFVNLTSVTIPNSVTSIGDSAFYYCRSLTSVKLPKNLKTIGSSAFTDCYALGSITIPAKVTEIGYGAFSGCDNLKITFNGNAPEIPSGGGILPGSATAYYPAGNSTWTEDVRWGLGSSTTWVAVCMDSHTLGEWTAVDENKHQRSCTFCEYRKTADHSWDEGTVTTAPTCQATGEALFTCTDCGATKTEVLPIADHPYSPWAEVDDATHTHACTVCGVEETVNHTWDEGKTVKAANCITDGEMRYTCTGCGATRTQTVSKTGVHTYDHGCDKDCNICSATRTTSHKYSSDWSSNKSGHWHTCVNCGAKQTAVAHVPGPAPTEEKPQLCTVCDYVLQPSRKHEHVFAEALTCDETGHWYACESCGEQKDLAQHDFDNDCDTKCDTCGFERITQHVWSEAWSHDEAGHFHVCSVCAVRQEGSESEHDWRRGVCKICEAVDPNYEPAPVGLIALIGAAVCAGVATPVVVLRRKKKNTHA